MKILECISNEHSPSYIVGKTYFAFEEGNVTKISNFPNVNSFFSSPLTTLIPMMFKIVEPVEMPIEKINDSQDAEIETKKEINPTEQMSLW